MNEFPVVYESEYMIIYLLVIIGVCFLQHWLYRLKIISSL